MYGYTNNNCRLIIAQFSDLFRCVITTIPIPTKEMACIKHNFIVSHRQRACDISKTFPTKLVSMFIISP